MKVIDLEELKLIQLDIVQALHDFCIENNIKYSLACGSLLGAIRHNGYIPWDDDIDVYMEREDYNKLIALFPKLYKGYYRFLCLETDTRWTIPYGKLCDVRTEIIEDVEGWLPIGINIDVYPVDSAPCDIKEWYRYNIIRTILREIALCKNRKINSNRSLGKNLTIFITKLLFLLFSPRFISKLISKYAQCFNNKKTASCLFENVQGIFQKKPFDKADFSETILHKFEDRELCVMKGYDHCLRCGFGDYMQLPPIEKRVSHHLFTAYWK